MSLLNKINCYRRSRKFNHVNEFFKAVNAQKDEIKKIEVRGSITQVSKGFLGEVQDYYSFLKYIALDQEGQPYLKYKHYIGSSYTFLGLGAGEQGSPIHDSSWQSIEKRILKLAEKYNCEDITKVMFAEQMSIKRPA